MLINLVAFAVIFTSLAVAHELGHLIWAKKAGIRVFELGLGFGPRLFAIERGGTTYSINLIPILAFVRIAGEGESEDDQNCALSELFYSKTPLQKFKTLFAGPAMNITFAFLLLFLLTLFAGTPTGLSTEVGAIIPHSPAELTGLKVGDRLKAINSSPITKMEDAIELIHKSPEKPLLLIVDRNGQVLTYKVTPKYNERLKISLIGFSPKPVYKMVGPLQSLLNAFEQTYSMIIITLSIVWKLLTGVVKITDLAGPVGIAQVTGRSVQGGLVSLVYFAAFLNVNIGVLNLLPIPALDGGHLVFVLIEALRRKAINPKLINKINYWGMIALLTLMAIVTLNDIGRLFGRS